MTARNLSATYTVTYPGDTEPTTITPKIRTKTRPDGVTLTIIKGLAPLLAEQIDAITDEGDRLHVLTVLSGAMICISDTPDDSRPENGESSGSIWRDRGTLATTYAGARGLPDNVVLDLAEQLRAQFASEAEALVGQAVAIATLVADQHGILASDVFTVEDLRRDLESAVSRVRRETGDCPTDLAEAAVVIVSAATLDATIEAGRIRRRAEEVAALSACLETCNVTVEVDVVELVGRALATAASDARRHSITVPDLPADLIDATYALRHAIMNGVSEPILPADLDATCMLLINASHAYRSPLAFRDLYRAMAAKAAPAQAS